MTTSYYGTGICLPIDADPATGLPKFLGEDTRNAFSTLITPAAGRPLGGRSGIRPGNDPGLTIDSTGAWTLQPVAGYVDPNTADGVGGYFFAFQSAVSGTIDPADGTHERIDRLDIQVPDDPAGAGNPLNARYVYKSGTPGATPVAPSVSPRSTPFALITVPAVGTGDPSIALNWQYVVAAGGITPCFSTSDRPSAKYAGLHIYDLASKQTMVWDGDSWTPYLGGDTGWQSAGIITTAANGTITSQLARKCGNLIQIEVAGTFPAASAGGGSNGDYGNMTLGTLSSAWRPAHGADIGSGNVGPNYRYHIGSDGVLQVTSGPTAGYAKGDSWSASGMYYAD